MRKKPFSHKLSDDITGFVGSWKGFVFHVILITSWMAFNTMLPSLAFDPFPFIFLNLALSTEAAVSACFVLMSQNRAAERDRKTLDESYVSNLENRLSMAEVADKLDKLETLIKRLNRGKEEKES